MNCICPVSSAFTYSEFQRAKINGNAKNSLKYFSLYLLGHLQEKNQRSERTFHLFGISKGQNSTADKKFKMISFQPIKHLAKCVLADLRKFFPLITTTIRT